MDYSRRDLGLLLTALTAAGASGQETALTSKTYRYEDLPVSTNGANHGRAILNGATHTGLPIELHETELGPGQQPHPPHHHIHEEMLMLREGTLEVTMGGRSVNLDPGSVVFVASNQEHGWRNVGTGHARYFVLALGRVNG
jgi:mannose-6-phosphate isomerase-like protein (cupin superfamily)